MAVVVVRPPRLCVPWTTMHTLFLTLFIVLCVSQSVGAPHADCDAVNALFAGTVNLTSGLSYSPPCCTDTVVCCGGGGDVCEIRVPGMGLGGQLNWTALTSLEALTALDVSDNLFTGVVSVLPIGLDVLMLQGNNFSCPLPAAAVCGLSTAAFARANQCWNPVSRDLSFPPRWLSANGVSGVIGATPVPYGSSPFNDTKYFDSVRLYMSSTTVIPICDSTPFVEVDVGPDWVEGAVVEFEVTDLYPSQRLNVQLVGVVDGQIMDGCGSAKLLDTLLTCTVTLKAGLLVPDGAPQSAPSATLEFHTATTAEVLLGDPADIDNGGFPVTGLRITAVSENGAVVYDKSVPAAVGQPVLHVVDGLEPGAPFTISVAANNSRGLGPSFALSASSCDVSQVAIRGAASAPGAPVCHECPFGSRACTGAETCAEGHTGALCTTCSDGWYRARTSSTCRKCSSTPYVSVVLVVGILVTGIYVSRRRKPSVQWGILLVVFNTVQVLQVMVLAIPYWSTGAISATEWFDTFVPTGSMMTNYKCWLGSDARLTPWQLQFVLIALALPVVCSIITTTSRLFMRRELRRVLDRKLVQSRPHLGSKKQQKAGSSGGLSPTAEELDESSESESEAAAAVKPALATNGAQPPPRVDSRVRLPPLRVVDVAEQDQSPPHPAQVAPASDDYVEQLRASVALIEAEEAGSNSQPSQPPTAEPAAPPPSKAATGASTNTDIDAATTAATTDTAAAVPAAPVDAAGVRPCRSKKVLQPLRGWSSRKAVGLPPEGGPAAAPSYVSKNRRRRLSVSHAIVAPPPSSKSQSGRPAASTTADTNPTHDDKDAGAPSVVPSTVSLRLATLVHKVGVGILLYAFVAVITAYVEAFQCFDAPDGRSYMLFNSEVECGSGPHVRAQVAGGLGLLVIAVCLIVMPYRVHVLRAGKNLHSFLSQASFGTLIWMFSWWDAHLATVPLARKAIVVVFASSLTGQPMIQLGAILVTNAAYLYVIFKRRPYVSFYRRLPCIGPVDTLNVLDLYVSFVTVILALVLLVVTTVPDVNPVVYGVGVAVIGASIVAAVVLSLAVFLGGRGTGAESANVTATGAELSAEIGRMAAEMRNAAVNHFDYDTALEYKLQLDALRHRQFYVLSDNGDSMPVGAVGDASDGNGGGDGTGTTGTGAAALDMPDAVAVSEYGESVASRSPLPRDGWSFRDDDSNFDIRRYDGSTSSRSTVGGGTAAVVADAGDREPKPGDAPPSTVPKSLHANNGSRLQMLFQQQSRRFRRLQSWAPVSAAWASGRMGKRMGSAKSARSPARTLVPKKSLFGQTFHDNQLLAQEVDATVFGSIRLVRAAVAQKLKGGLDITAAGPAPEKVSARLLSAVTFATQAMKATVVAAMEEEVLTPLLKAPKVFRSPAALVIESATLYVNHRVDRAEAGLMTALEAGDDGTTAMAQLAALASLGERAGLVLSHIAGCDDVMLPAVQAAPYLQTELQAAQERASQVHTNLVAARVVNQSNRTLTLAVRSFVGQDARVSQQLLSAQDEAVKAASQVHRRRRWGVHLTGTIRGLATEALADGASLRSMVVACVKYHRSVAAAFPVHHSRTVMMAMATGSVPPPSGRLSSTRTHSRRGGTFKRKSHNQVLPFDDGGGDGPADALAPGPATARTVHRTFSLYKNKVLADHVAATKKLKRRLLAAAAVVAVGLAVMLGVVFSGGSDPSSPADVTDAQQVCLPIQFSPLSHCVQPSYQLFVGGPMGAMSTDGAALMADTVLNILGLMGSFLPDGVSIDPAVCATVYAGPLCKALHPGCGLETCGPVLPCQSSCLNAMQLCFGLSTPEQAIGLAAMIRPGFEAMLQATMESRMDPAVSALVGTILAGAMFCDSATYDASATCDTAPLLSATDTATCAAGSLVAR